MFEHDSQALECSQLRRSEILCEPLQTRPPLVGPANHEIERYLRKWFEHRFLVDLTTHEQEAEVDVCTAQRFAVIIIRADGAAWNSFPVGNIYPLDVARRNFYVLPRMLAAHELIVLGIFVVFPIFRRTYVNRSATEHVIVYADAKFWS